MFYYNNNYEQNESEQTYLNSDMVSQISLCHNTPFFHGLLSLSQRLLHLYDNQELFDEFVPK